MTIRFATLLLSLLLALAAPAAAITFVVEGESLELFGGWELHANPRSDTSRGYIVATPAAPKAPAVGAVELPHGGKWRLWVRSKDFPEDRPGTRRFTVRIGEVKSPTRFGAHGQGELEGWAWEDGGILELKEGVNLVVLGDEVQSTARCDALVLTDNMSYRPEGVPWKLGKTPAVKAKVNIGREPLPGSGESAAPAAASVGISAERGLKLEWAAARLGDGQAYRLLGAGRAVELNGHAEQYQVLFRPLDKPPKHDAVKIYPTWDQDFAPFADVSAGWARARTRLGTPTTPWTAGECFSMRPSALKRDGQTLVMEFAPTRVGRLEARWRVKAGSPVAHVTLRFTPSVPGHFSLGYHAPFTSAPAEADFLLLPFMLQGRRFPEHPTALLSSSMPTPLAMVSARGATSALFAEPDALPFEWASNANARFALGLRNERGQAQPFIYAPVLGQPGSRVESGAVEARFRLWLDGGGWYQSYRAIVDGAYGLSDYREPTQASLSDTALNLLDFIRNEEASGWNAKAKGPWNIESRNTVTHSAPLTYLSYYLLTGDEDIYRRFARPALEYLVSRPGPHFAAEREIWANYYQHQPMRGPAAFFGARWFAGALAMTHGRTPAFADHLLNAKGEPRVSAPHGHTHAFDDSLALYQLTGEPQWLERARAEADKYIEANLTKLPERDLGSAPFINVSFTPNWEGLLHLYEATQEPRYLDAAAEGARWLLTSLWVRPQPEGEITINPGGVYDAQRHLWWWGDRLYRRAIIDIPATENPPYPPAPHLLERKVPLWKVSNVGLGLEQPSTFNRSGPRAHILMSNWAPNLLRLASYTKDAAFRTAARNAMIGRFGNYPGYYLDGFTDEYHRASYPVTGPDITSLYVHHVPPFAASVIDYLYTDAEMRSGGEIEFPSVRQAGYVWFDNRLYGHAPGRVIDDTAWPWLHRTAVTLDNPKIDRVLAQGDGKLHVILLNQSHKPAPVRLRFHEKVLGRDLSDAAIVLRAPTKLWTDLPVPRKPPGWSRVEGRLRDAEIALSVQPDTVTVLTLEGVKLDIPTHRTAPAKDLPLPLPGQVRHAKVAGTSFEAVGLTMQAPPFTWRDLYVYFTAGLDDAIAARFHYRVGGRAEESVEVKQFPFEFSAKLPAGDDEITWRAELQLPNGRWVPAE